MCVWSVWEIEGCALSQRHYTTGTANSLRAEKEWPREQATIKQASETSGQCSDRLYGPDDVCVFVCVCVCARARVCVCVCVCVACLAHASNV